jgi:hypothetical protein
VAPPLAGSHSRLRPACWVQGCPSELGPSQPGGQLAVAAQRPELVSSTTQEEQDTAAVRSTGGKPVGWAPAIASALHGLACPDHRSQGTRSPPCKPESAP